MEQPDFGGKSALTERKDDQLVTMDNNAGDASREALSLPQVVHLPPSSHHNQWVPPGQKCAAPESVATAECRCLGMKTNLMSMCINYNRILHAAERRQSAYTQSRGWNWEGGSGAFGSKLREYSTCVSSCPSCKACRML